jgi:glycosyltransferase involved in cell wall biosynthesis
VSVAPPGGRRIVHVVTSLDARHGGVARIVPALAAAQRDLVCPIAPSVDGDNEVGGIADIHLATRAGGMPPLRRGDIVHLHGLWEPELWRAARRASRAGAHTIWTLHGMLDRWSRRQRIWKKRAAWLLYQRGLLTGAAGLTINSAQEWNEAAEWLGRGAPPHTIIPNGVALPPSPHRLHDDPASPSPSLASAWRAEQRIPLTAPLLLFFGRLHAKKGIALLPAILSAVSAVQPDAHLAIVGAAAPDQLGLVEALRRDVEDRGLATRVRWSGFVDGDNRWAALAAADVVLFPSAEEGMSMAILEALAAGAAVVATPACRMAAARDAGALVEAGRTARDFAAALLALLGAPDRRAALAEAARLHVANHHRWEAVARRTLDFYFSTTSSTAPAARQ